MSNDLAVLAQAAAPSPWSQPSVVISAVSLAGAAVIGLVGLLIRQDRRINKLAPKSKIEELVNALGTMATKLEGFDKQLGTAADLKSKVDAQVAKLDALDRKVEKLQPVDKCVVCRREVDDAQRVAGREWDEKFAKLHDELRDGLHNRATKGELQAHGHSLAKAHQAIAVVQSELAGISKTLAELREKVDALPRVEASLENLTAMLRGDRT